MIHINEDDPEVVRALLEYLYRLDYTMPENSDILFHIRAYAIAEVYDVQGMKALATERFQALGRVGWNSPTFPRAVKEIYGTTPDSDRGLRDVVVGVAVEHVQELLKKEDFQKAVDETGPFGKDLLRAVLKPAAIWRVEAEEAVNKTSQRCKRYLCPRCKREVEMVVPDKGRCRCLRCGKERGDWESFQTDLLVEEVDDRGRRWSRRW